MRKKFAYGFLIFALLTSFCFYALAQKRANYKPKEGYVPDEQTAITIAVAVWIPIYGKDLIEKEKPHYAELKNGVWEVRGSLPEGFFGGTTVAEISKNDGRILRVFQER